MAGGADFALFSATKSMDAPAPLRRDISFWTKMLAAFHAIPRRRFAVAVVCAALSFPVNAGSILREVFEGISGNAITDLTSSPNYPNSPSFTELITDYFEAPTDVLEEYGQRMHGYIVPPVSGNYTFWIASDDNGSLLLSTDETPARARQIAQVPEWTSSREWTKYPAQRSALINLQANKAYYISALMKEGGGGDNLAVRWLRPDGVDEAPIPATYLLPWGTAFTPPAISQQPTNTTAIEGQLATFMVKVTNVDPVSVQWRRNGVNIPTGTSFTLNFGPVTMADDRATFGAVLTNRIGATNTTLATLTVLADTTKPDLVSAVNLGADRILVRFSEPVEAATATVAANYSVSGGITVTSAILDTDSRAVVLTVNPLTFAQNYTITVRGIRDRASTPNTIEAERSTSFLALELVSQGIGLAGGSITRLGTGAFQVTGAGHGANGPTDEFQFAWELRTGNFDMRVRVDNVGITDPYVQAGLMARANLGTNAPFAAAFCSSAQVGSYFLSRNSIGGATSLTAPRGGFPFNGRQTWLRLQRSGNILTGYGSFDGTSWTTLGSATLSLGSPVYVGLAVSSRQTAAPTTARFHDYGESLNPVITPLAIDREPLGPATRSTGIVISEIMYHPRPPTGVTNNLEFIELYNAGPIFEDLGGWQLRGAIEFTFPAGFKLEAGAFVLVSADPAAIQSNYKVAGGFGPFTGSLNNAGEQITLHDPFGALKLEVNYSPRPPWPASPDGGGHSLILARPSYGSVDPRAWAASELVGGSPGFQDAIQPSPLKGVLINEFLAHTDDPQLDFIELFNSGRNPVVLDGCILTDDATTNRFRIPTGTTLASRGHLSFDQAALGFRLSSGGENIYLLSPDGTRVLDAISFSAQENGVASGRTPDGAPTIRRLIQPTPGAANTPWRPEDIVINEVMFNPISRSDDDEYLELLNRSAETVNLAGWRFTDGIDFEFPSGTTLAAGNYLVVARNTERFRANYPALTQAQILGNYSGSLANRGERVALARPDEVVSTNDFGDRETNHIFIEVAETTYRDEGRWHRWADGGGSSLELVDPDSDPLEPANWADSDESSKAPWTSISFTGTLDHGMLSPDRFQMALMGAGECLVDDVEFVPAGGQNLLSNAGFESASGWAFAGNHFASRLQNGGAFSGNRCLRLVAQGDGDTGPNCVRSPIGAPPTIGSQATIRAKVRWLRGWPEILLRTRGNWIEAYGRLELPSNLGTPGALNSRRIPNAGPVITQVLPTPVLPTANQPVIVTARVADPQGLISVNLRYRTDGSSTMSSVSMRDDGSAPDVAAGDGIYSGTLPGRSEGTLVAFRIEATDAAPTAATSIFPPAYPDSECLVRWGDPAPTGSFAHYHMWTTQATENAHNSPSGLNNRYRDSTLVYGNFRVIYGAGFRSKGSPFHGGRGDFAVVVPKDELLLGAEDRVLALTGNGDIEETGMRGQVANWLAYRLGIPHLHSHYIRLYRNGGQYANVMEDLEQPNNQFAEGFFPAVEEGDLYKIAVWFEFNDDDQGFDARGATTERFTSPGLGLKPARYRWNWQTRGWLGSANNLTNIFNLINAANSSTDYNSRMQAVGDMEQWMRVFAFTRICGNWDAWTFSVGQNMYIYFQPGERAKLIPWDIDFVLGRGNGPTDPLGGGTLGGNNQDPVSDKLYNEPEFRRALFRAYLDAIGGPMLPAEYQPQLDARKAALQNNGFSVGTGGELRDPRPIATYLDARRNYLQTQINSVNRAFAITSNGGNNFTATQPFATLTGTAPFAVAVIEVNGVPYPVAWTDVNTFRLVVPLTAQSNPLALVGKDRRGNPVVGATDSVTVTYNGATPQAQDYVVISEIQYNSLAPGGSYIELHNRSANTPFDLSGFVLQGVGYTFPPGAVLAPNGYLVLAKDRTEFALAYGNTIGVFDEFPGSLDNGGETLTLLDPGEGPGQEVVISSVRYDDDPPWPATAAGLGPALQLIDPAAGSWRVANWMATATTDANRVTPGRANAARATLAAFPELWLNEVMPNQANGPTDNVGEREPFIELYNSGSAEFDLSGLYLSDSYSNLTRWSFPAQTKIGPRSFLVIWADGETAESTPLAPHTNFRLDPADGTVALARQQGTPQQPAVLDYINYSQFPVGRSFGSYPDGDPRGRRTFFNVTPGATNDPAFPPIDVTINEFMASNTRTIVNPLTGSRDDWFELYNAGTSAVDLTGYYLSDTLTNRTQFQIPPGFVLPPAGVLLVWADEETRGNTNGSTQLHASFRLSAGGESLALFAPDGTLVDGFSFPAQQSDVSEGRFPDGQPGSLVAFDQPTPGSVNQLTGGNRPPEVSPVPDKSVAEGTPLVFTVTAADEVGQTIRYSLGADAPPEATIHELTGAFSWTPTEVEGPGTYGFTIRATDNGSPARTGVTRVTVNVSEVNRTPVFEGLVNRAADERSTLTFLLKANDPDLPSNTLRFAFEGTIPAGLTLNSATGEAQWTPAEHQGPGVYPVRVKVSDNGSPAAHAIGDFTITVNEVNNPPDFADIQPQTVDETAPFSLQVTAADSDNPPAALRYSLEGNLPSGININPDSGRITWIPGESQGPETYIIVVRATEQNATALSSSRSFGLTVNEVNQTPKLAPLSDLEIEEGTTVRFRATASDADLPGQKLTFTLEGPMPAGATIDANTGEFVWPVPPDTGASTHTITVRVTDDGPGALSAAQSFKVVVTPKFAVVIHEIMYRPSAANAEYIELRNSSAVTAWNLTGYRLVGEDLNYAFPANSTLAPGGFLCVVRNAAAFASAYGAVPRAAGVWTGTLGVAGDYLRLLPPPPAEVSLSAVRFGATQPWPTAANGAGASLQLIDERRDPARVANWSGAPAYTGPRQLIVMTNLWRYYQSGPVDASWIDPGFNDLAWPQGRALLYREEASLPGPKNTLLNLGQRTYYFRTSFVLPSVPAGAFLKLTTIIDDGAVFYLNGVEVYRQNIAATAVVDFNTPATPNVTDAVLTGPFTVPAEALRVGTNVFTVEVHQSGVGSSDIVMGCSLTLEGGNLPGFTPGASNNVATARTEFPAVWLNEVLANNTTGRPDRVGEREPWIELVNMGSTEVVLDGWSLSDNYADLVKWKFPSNTRIPAGGFLTIVADGETAEADGSELHTNFRLSANSGRVALARPISGTSELADYMDYAGLAANEAYAALPDGQPFVRAKTAIPTPGEANSTSQANRPPILNAIGPKNVNEGVPLGFIVSATDPDSGQQLVYSLVGNVPSGVSLHQSTGAFAWTPSEADGPGSFDVTVRATDSGIPPRTDEETFTIQVREVNRAPTLSSMLPQSIAVGQTLTYGIAAQDTDLPAQTLTFSLTGAPDGMTIGATSGEISWTPAANAIGTHPFTIRVTDGGAEPNHATTPMTVTVTEPSFPVIGGVGTDGALKLSWASRTGVNYRIEMVSILGAPWESLATLPGTGAAMTYSVPLDRTPPRYFRVVIP